MIKTKNAYYFLIAIIAVHVFILSRLIFFPYPEMFIYSYLTDQGLLPYTQIFDQHFPGLMFFPINFATLGMTTPEAARIWQYGIVAITQVLLFFTARRFFKSSKWALISSVLYVLWQPFFEGYVLWIDSFIPLFLISAFYFLSKREKSEADFFLAGSLLGISLIFKQVVFPLIILSSAYLLLRKTKKKMLIWFGVGISIPVTLLLLYILIIGVWKDFYFWTFTFNITTFADMGRKYASLGELGKSGLVFGLALIALIYELSKKRLTNSKMALGVFFLGSLIFAYARFDFVHLQPALPFAVLLTALFIKEVSRDRLKLVGFTYLIATFAVVIPFYKVYLGNRNVFFGDFERKLVEKVHEHAKQGEVIFTLGTTPHLYQLTKTLPPGDVFVFQFPWFMVEAEDKILEGLMSNHPRVIARDPSATTGGVNLIQYMPKINQFVDENYKIVDEVENTEILIPK